MSVDLMEVGVPRMDEDHQFVVGLVEEILALLDKEQGNDLVTAKLKELSEHSKHHFLWEEEQMELYGFPAFQVHKQEHQCVLKEFNDTLNEWEASYAPIALANYLSGPFCRWLENHVATMDWVTGDFLRRATRNG